MPPEAVVGMCTSVLDLASMQAQQVKSRTSEILVILTNIFASTYTGMSSQPEANRSHHLKEPCPRWFSAPHCPEKRARASQELENAQRAGETILGRRKSRRCAQPGVGPRRTFLDASTQWSSTDAVRLKENELALTFLGVPQNITKMRSEERWLAACFPDFQPGPIRGHGPGEINSIYEFPSPLVSTTAFHPSSVFVEESTWKHQEQSMDSPKVPDTEPTSLTDHSVDRWPPEKKAFGSLGEEEVQCSEEILLEAIVLDSEKPLEDIEEDPVTPSPVVSGFFFGTEANPSLQELPISMVNQVTFSAITEDANPKTHSITTLGPLVHKMFQIDFPLPAEEEEARTFQGGE
ncbi:uncharacterized protein [Erythrolamprus reginae]|uniref:uncharacterized protein n=1 Tax=Erythrolamprus reginae TaxID=121349 RepID=UPI00396CCD69